MNNFKKDFLSKLRAGCPLIEVVTFEEIRAEDDIGVVAKEFGANVFRWSTFRGMENIGIWDSNGNFSWYDKEPFSQPDGNQKIEDLIQSIAFTDTLREAVQADLPNIVIMKDIHNILDSSGDGIVSTRAIRDAVKNLLQKRIFLVFITPKEFVPFDLQKDIKLISYSLPDRDEVAILVKNTIKGIEDGLDDIDKKNFIKPKKDVIDGLTEACLGLSVREIENSISIGVVQHLGFPPEIIESIQDEKANLIKGNGILKYYHIQEGMNIVGGLESFKSWLRKRKRAFGPEAIKYGISPLKGILLVGVMGCVTGDTKIRVRKISESGKLKIFQNK